MEINEGAVGIVIEDKERGIAIAKSINPESRIKMEFKIKCFKKDLKRMLKND